jgi:hypothetical protein
MSFSHPFMLIAHVPKPRNLVHVSHSSITALALKHRSMFLNHAFKILFLSHAFMLIESEWNIQLFKGRDQREVRGVGKLANEKYMPWIEVIDVFYG